VHPVGLPLLTPSPPPAPPPPVYDSIVNPGHWTEEMREDALEPAKLTSPDLKVHAGGGGGERRGGASSREGQRQGRGKGGPGGQAGGRVPAAAPPPAPPRALHPHCSPPPQVVDVGGGTGFCTLGIVKSITPSNVTLIDQSPHQLAKAKGKPALKDVTILEVTPRRGVERAGPRGAGPAQLWSRRACRPSPLGRAAAVKPPYPVPAPPG
jgi:hypothetical protein